MILATFIGGLIFFLFGRALLEVSLQRTNRFRLRNILKLLARHRIVALLFGSLVTVGTQSSTATVTTLVSVVNAGLLQLSQAVALVLGASIGTTLMIQLLTFQTANYALWLVVIGFLISRISRLKWTFSGELLLSLGLMFYGISLMGNGILLFRVTSLGETFLQGISRQPLLNMAGAFLFTLICQTTLAPLAVGITLIRDGGVPLNCTLPIILGAHIGASILPLITSWGKSNKIVAIRLAWANLGYRVLSALIFLPFLVPWAEFTQWLTSFFVTGPAVTSRYLANAHTIFTLITVGIFIPLVQPYTRLITKLVPQKEPSAKQLLYLNSQLGDSLTDIFTAARKEVGHLAQEVHHILSNILDLWEKDSLKEITQIETTDESIQARHNAIAGYLTQIPRKRLTPEWYQTEIKLLGISDNLKKISNLAGKNLTEIFTRRITQGLSFSIEGLHELLTIHKQILTESDQLLVIFKESGELRNILALGDKIDSLITASQQAHIDRMHRGILETRETTSLHLDALAVLEHIHHHLQKTTKTYATL